MPWWDCERHDMIYLIVIDFYSRAMMNSARLIFIWECFSYLDKAQPRQLALHYIYWHCSAASIWDVRLITLWVV